MGFLAESIMNSQKLSLIESIAQNLEKLKSLEAQSIINTLYSADCTSMTDVVVFDTGFDKDQEMDEVRKAIQNILLYHGSDSVEIFSTAFLLVADQKNVFSALIKASADFK